VFITVLSVLSKIYERIMQAAVFAAGILVIFLMLSVGLEVGLRYFLDRPTSWVVEIAGYILLYIPFLVGSWVLRNDSHVKMDFVFDQLSASTQSLINTITSFAGAAICLVITWYGIRVALYFSKMGYKTPTVLMLPKSLLIGIIFFGFFLLAIQFFIKGCDSLKRWRTPIDVDQSYGTEEISETITGDD
jgi:TRAP-type C4-dicarboxylate transport system permease small subunit